MARESGVVLSANRSVCAPGVFPMMLSSGEVCGQSIGSHANVLRREQRRQRSEGAPVPPNALPDQPVPIR